MGSKAKDKQNSINGSDKIKINIKKTIYSKFFHVMD